MTPYPLAIIVRYPSICDLIFFLCLRLALDAILNWWSSTYPENRIKHMFPIKIYTKKNKFMLYRHFFATLWSNEMNNQKIDWRKCGEITTFCIIFNFVGRLWREVFRRQDGDSNFESRKNVFAEELTHTMIFLTRRHPNTTMTVIENSHHV